MFFFSLHHNLQSLPHTELCWLQFLKEYRFYAYLFFYLVESFPILTIQGVNDNVAHFPKIKASLLHNTMKLLNRKRKRKNLISGEVWKYTLKNIQERNKGIWHPLEIFSILLKHMRKADVPNGKLKCPITTQQNHPEWFTDARIFLCQERSLEIQINVDNPSIQRLWYEVQQYTFRELVSLEKRPRIY